MKTTNRAVRLAASSLIAILASSSAFAWQASLTTLNAISQVTENACGATSISDNGNVIGGYSRSDRTASARAASFWRSGPDAHELRGFATKNLWGHVRALVPNGSIVVGSTTRGNNEEPFRWTPATGTRSLPMPASFEGGEAMGVSDDGSVVVGFGNYVGSLFNRPVQLTEAMMWVNGQPTALGFVGSGAWSKAYDVSADGRVIVGEAHLNTSIGEYMAVLWINGAGPIEVGDLPGGYDRSRAVAVSTDGDTIAGWGSKLYHPFIHRMFRWTRAAGMADLGFVNGHQLAEATAMTADGSVIVGWGQIAGSANRIPVIWDAANGLRELMPILEAAGVDLSAWQDWAGQIFMQPTGISADGKTIVGFGNLNNSRRAWSVTLP
ncbi:MAG: putative membrane protein [Candidatus Paceibacteria bacterium]|jgi:uncharacterized membrane protein